MIRRHGPVGRLGHVPSVNRGSRHLLPGALGGDRFRSGDVGRLLVGWLVAAGGLGIAAAVLPGLDVQGPGALFVGSLAVGVLGGLLRPLLVAGSLVLGWAGVLVAAVLAQAVVVQVAVDLTPGIESNSLGTSLVAGIITATFATAASWLLTSGTDEAFLSSLVRQGSRTRRRARQRVTDDLDGVVFVQLDGVPHQAASWGVTAGTLPTLARWVRGGSHRLARWEVQVPCTTPVSQAGILHGTVRGLPAFRWYDRGQQRLLVASKPADMAEVERRISDGWGLLADDGVSVGNIFSGDAPTALATMSRIGGSRDPGPARRFSRYLTQPNGLVRSLVRAVAEVGRERFEARRQQRLDVLPRMHRSRTFALVRAMTNGLMRDMNTALVAEAILGGARAVYVDLVDYDEVAHHAGPLRPESLRTLQTLDGVLAALERVAAVAPRRYHFVVLSDHGQSQGATFRQRYGEELADLVRELTGQQPVGAADAEVEGWGRVDMVRSTVESTGGAAGRLARAGGTRTAAHVEQPTTRPAEEAPEWLVVGSGNLGLIYATGSPRLSLEDLEQQHPRLVSGLLAHPGVGFVVARSQAGPVAIGAGGRRNLADGTVTGEDPLAGLPAAAEDLRACIEDEDGPDLYVNSLVEPDTEEVAAFEELVGCHGGLGGWQTAGTLVVPASWPIPDRIHGADHLHHVLVGWLERLGHRAALGAPRLPGARQRPDRGLGGQTLRSGRTRK